MRLLAFFLIFYSYSVVSKSIVFLPPEGMKLLSTYVAETQLERNAIIASRDFLEKRGENVNAFYVSDSGLDMENGVFLVTIKHTSTFRSSKREIDESYKNGVIHYDPKTDKVLKYIHGK